MYYTVDACCQKRTTFDYSTMLLLYSIVFGWSVTIRYAHGHVLYEHNWPVSVIMLVYCYVTSMDAIISPMAMSSNLVLNIKCLMLYWYTASLITITSTSVSSDFMALYKYCIIIIIIIIIIIMIRLCKNKQRWITSVTNQHYSKTPNIWSHIITMSKTLRINSFWL